MTAPGRVKKDPPVSPDISKAMIGVLAILVAEREERLNGTDKPTKTEVILSNAGFTAPEIAQVMGKSLDGVRKTIQRGRK